METNKIYQQDCLEFMKGLPDGCVDLVVTSPPYNFGGFNRNHYASSYDVYDDDKPEEEYREWMGEVLNECSRIIKEGGAMYWNHKGKYRDYVYMPPFWVVDKCPLQLYNHIVWKIAASPDFAKSKWWPRHEEIFMFTKGKPSFFNEELAQFTDVWDINNMQNNPHPAPFPLRLARRCIEASCPVGGLVYDPFMGSGTTAVAAVEAKREFIGTEISPAYAEMASRRARNAIIESPSLF